MPSTTQNAGGILPRSGFVYKSPSNHQMPQGVGFWEITPGKRPFVGQRPLRPDRRRSVQRSGAASVTAFSEWRVIRSELRRSARPPQEQPGEKPAARNFRPAKAAKSSPVFGTAFWDWRKRDLGGEGASSCPRFRDRVFGTLEALYFRDFQFRRMVKILECAEGTRFSKMGIERQEKLRGRGSWPTLPDW
jgi:hypothetical protein